MGLIAVRLEPTITVMVLHLPFLLPGYMIF